MDIFARQQAKPFFLVLIRLVVMVALALATYGILRMTGISRDFPPTDTIYSGHKSKSDVLVVVFVVWVLVLGWLGCFT